MVCFGQVEAKQVQNANDQVKLSGNPQIEGKIGDQKADELRSSGYFLWGNHQVIINKTI